MLLHVSGFTRARADAARGGTKHLFQRGVVTSGCDRRETRRSPSPRRPVRSTLAPFGCEVFFFAVLKSSPSPRIRTCVPLPDGRPRRTTSTDPDPFVPRPPVARAALADGSFYKFLEESQWEEKREKRSVKHLLQL